MNLGVQDAQNLAWKIAAVLHGEADPSLLDSYEAERRPHALEVVHATLLNMQSFDRSRRQAEARLPRRNFSTNVASSSVRDISRRPSCPTGRSRRT